ncbi:hypothetical protein ACO2KH_01885 [Leptospira terpstrae]|uniref:hypothetical protein n=1 Tax=Leptospira terpstrae TaxID=293075 RepID=UPI003D06F66E
MNKKFILMIIVFFQLSCVGWGEYREIRLEPQVVSEQDGLVNGRSCSFFLIPPVPKLNNAILNALEKAPGKKGLKNPLIKDISYFIGRCFLVEGYATNSL